MPKVTIRNTLISSDQLNRDGIHVNMPPTGVQIINPDGEIIARSESRHKILKLRIEPSVFIQTCYPDNYSLWHDRLGHLNNSLFHKLKHDVFKDSDSLAKVLPRKIICEFCMKGKQTRESNEESKDKSHIQRVLQVIHSDVCGKVSPTTKDGENYFVTFVDDFTHYCVVYLMKNKSEVVDKFKDFVAKSEALFGTQIAYLYCDNGGEYLSQEMKSFCSTKGIQYHLTSPHTPVQNPVAERMNRTIVEKARSILYRSKLSKGFWGEAVMTAVFLINRLPTKANGKYSRTPYELWHNRKPILKYLRVFGCTAYVHNKVMNNKFDTRSIKGIFVGYEPCGFRIWIPETRRIVVSKDVKFDETNFELSRPTESEDAFINVEQHVTDRIAIQSVGKNKTITNPEADIFDISDFMHGSIEVISAGDSRQALQLHRRAVNDEVPLKLHRRAVNVRVHPNEKGDSGSSVNVQEELHRRAVLDNVHPIGKDHVDVDNVQVPMKLRRLAVNQENYVDQDLINPVQNLDSNADPVMDHEHMRDNKQCTSVIEPEKARRSERLKKDDYLGEKYMDYVMAMRSIVSLPNSFGDLNSREDKDQWLEAVSDELKSLELNKTWNYVKRPDDCNIVDCRWVFTVKNDEYGNIVKYKARLVAKGFSQQYLVDYNETFAPVSRMTSFRIIAAIANQYDLMLHHMDVKTAYLNGELKETVYMRIPEGITHKEPNQVCRLNKALYGLKQSARCWFELFDKVIRDYGFINSKVDRCIYILKGNDKRDNVYLVLYVDDLLICTGSQVRMDELKTYLMKRFLMVDLKEIRFFLGIKIQRSGNKLTLDQSAYIKTVLEKFNMVDCNPVKTPLVSNINFINLESEIEYNAPCKSVLGCLMYIMLCTRPDICYAVNVTSRYAAKNNIEVWNTLKRILRYLKSTINFKLTYKRQVNKELVQGYVDSDWGGSFGTNRRSTTGFVFKMFESCTICWNTRKQNTVADSSTEAEYMALAEAVKESCWIKQLVQSIDFKIDSPIGIFEDNAGCIKIANNPSCHKNTKHIDIKYHISRERIESKDIVLISIPTEFQQADVFTKSLPAERFIKLTRALGVDEE